MYVASTCMVEGMIGAPRKKSCANPLNLVNAAWYAVRVLGATEASISCLIICWREEGVVGIRLGPLQAMELPALLLPPGIEIAYRQLYSAYPGYVLP